MRPDAGALRYPPRPMLAAFGPHQADTQPGEAMDWIDMLQWPAMAITVAATWLIGSRIATRRKVGFWVFLLSNLLWVVWGLHTSAYALVVLQFALAALNLRGMRKAKQVEENGATQAGPAGSAEAQ
ncbi:hypothetical protein [Cupriavidus sp. H18C1]|uniref:hypothetical protein n=1 Tax=Cupriavidus sp. H18C1 TaxID=3241601 RepID=UPI003BB92540